MGVAIGLVGGFFAGGHAADAAAKAVNRADDTGTASRLPNLLIGAGIGALAIGGFAALHGGLGMSGAFGAAMTGRTPINIAMEGIKTGLRTAVKPAIIGAAVGGAVGALAPTEHDEMWGAVKDSLTPSLTTIGLTVGGAVLGGAMNLAGTKSGSAFTNPVVGALTGAVALGGLALGTQMAIRIAGSTAGGGLAAVTD
jgi:hypothetical protein